MLEIGIDYSINSPAICVQNGSKLEFISLARIGVANEKFYETLESFKVKVITSNPLKNSPTVLDSSRESILDAISLATKTVNGIIEICGPGDNTQNVLAIEGFSFGSKGNRLAQLAGYQYVLRMQTLAYLISPINIENMWLFAPATVKSTAGAAGRGKGKGDMITAFLEHEDKLPGLEEHPFYIEMKKNPETFQNKKGKWQKPIDDLIDAYWILKTYHKKSSQA